MARYLDFDTAIARRGWDIRQDCRMAEDVQDPFKKLVLQRCFFNDVKREREKKKKREGVHTRPLIGRLVETELYLAPMTVRNGGSFTSSCSPSPRSLRSSGARIGMGDVEA